MTFIKQFTGKPFWWILGGLVVLDIASFLTLHSAAETVLFILVSMGLVALAWRRPEWIFPLAIAEIIATSNGHSLNVELFGASIGIRMVLFAILLVISAVEILRKRQNPIPRQYRLLLAIFVATIVYALVMGLLGGESIKDVYLDANGYIAIGYVLVAFIWSKDALSRRRLLQAAGAGVTWIIAKTLLFMFTFGHLHPKTLDPLYIWIRDTRLGEITLQRANVYRVFLQSQWFIVPAMFLSSAYIVFSEKFKSVFGGETGARVLFLVSTAAIIASMSRTYWVAIVAAAIVCLVITIFGKRLKQLVRSIPMFALTSIASIALLWVIVAVPIFQSAGSNIFGDLFAERATKVSDAAIDSRQQLLDPMLAIVFDAPIAGHGYGKNVTYETSDPRYIDNHDTNIVSTYAFEWGWLDIWIKMGIVGLFVFVLLLIQILRDLYYGYRQDKAKRWLYVGLALTVIALAATHFFSPYLNHPIGWGTLAVVIALIPSVSKEPIKARLPKLSTKKKQYAVTTRNYGK